MTMILYVGNFPFSATAEALHCVFQKHGAVTNIKIVADQLGHSLGFAFVTMANGAEEAIASLNGADFQGRPLIVNEAQQTSEKLREDRFADIIDRYSRFYERQESAEFRQVVDDLRELAHAGHVDAAQQLADVLAYPGLHFDAESAYKWYYIALSQQGYTVEFDDQNHTPPYYCGPVGDFRNESMPSDLVVALGFEKIRCLDADAARWLAERNLK